MANPHIPPTDPNETKSVYSIFKDIVLSAIDSILPAIKPLAEQLPTELTFLAFLATITIILAMVSFAAQAMFGMSANDNTQQIFDYSFIVGVSGTVLLILSRLIPTQSGVSTIKGTHSKMTIRKPVEVDRDEYGNTINEIDISDFKISITPRLPDPIVDSNGTMFYSWNYMGEFKPLTIKVVAGGYIIWEEQFNHKRDIQEPIEIHLQRIQRNAPTTTLTVVEKVSSDEGFAEIPVGNAHIILGDDHDYSDPITGRCELLTPTTNETAMISAVGFDDKNVLVNIDETNIRVAIAREKYKRKLNVRVTRNGIPIENAKVIIANEPSFPYGITKVDGVVELKWNPTNNKNREELELQVLINTTNYGRFPVNEEEQNRGFKEVQISDSQSMPWVWIIAFILSTIFVAFLFSTLTTKVIHLWEKSTLNQSNPMIPVVASSGVAFRIQQNEVSIGQYRLYNPDYGNPNDNSSEPITIGFNTATDFCSHFGYRLPTRTEYETLFELFESQAAYETNPMPNISPNNSQSDVIFHSVDNLREWVGSGCTGLNRNERCTFGLSYLYGKPDPGLQLDIDDYISSIVGYDISLEIVGFRCASNS